MIEFVFFPRNRLCSLVPYDFLVLFPCSHYKIHRVPLVPQKPLGDPHLDETESNEEFNSLKLFNVCQCATSTFRLWLR